jgi:hypothetical protein
MGHPTPSLPRGECWLNGLLWFAIGAVGLTTLYCSVFRPHSTTLPKSITEPMAGITPPMPPPPDLPPLPVPAIPTIEAPVLKQPVFAPPALPAGKKASVP